MYLSYSCGSEEFVSESQEHLKEKASPIEVAIIIYNIELVLYFVYFVM